MMWGIGEGPGDNYFFLEKLSGVRLRVLPPGSFWLEEEKKKCQDDRPHEMPKRTLRI